MAAPTVPNEVNRHYRHTHCWEGQMEVHDGWPRSLNIFRYVKLLYYVREDVVRRYARGRDEDAGPEPMADVLPDSVPDAARLLHVANDTGGR
jgi:hypothetical protein